MAQAQLNANQVEQARSYASDLNKYYPDYVPGKLLQAQISLRAGDEESMKNAQRDASQIIDGLARLTPSQQYSPELIADLRAKAYTARGAAELKLKNATAAQADFTAARDAEPNAPASYFNLAAVSLAENKPAEAEQLYEHALQLDGANYDALGGLINLYTAQKQFDRAHAAKIICAGLRFNLGGDFLNNRFFGQRNVGV